MLLSQNGQEKKKQLKAENSLQERNDESEHELSGKAVSRESIQVINVPTAVCVYLIALMGLSIITDGCSVVCQKSCGRRTDVHLRQLMCVHVCGQTV